MISTPSCVEDRRSRIEGNDGGRPKGMRSGPVKDDELETAIYRENGRNIADGVLEGRVLLGEAMRGGVELPEELEPGLLIRGSVHHLFAGPGVGKTWLALWLIKNAIGRGQAVAFFDTENGQRIISERLVALGVDSSQVDARLFYYPTLSMGLDMPASFRRFLDAIKPDLVVFDSWLDHLANANLSENEATDIATWAARYSRPARDRGCTVVLLDHVPHDGKRARGSTRKKDEVDVQWRLTRPEPFDRQKVGRIVLRREKDREAVLPQVVKFEVGGSSDGFVFLHSGETAEESQGDNGLTVTQRKALDALKTYGEKGAGFVEWHTSCKLAKSTFGDAKQLLERTGRVEKYEKRYFAAHKTQCPEGPTGHPSDAAEHPNGMSGTSGGPPRPPDRTSVERAHGTELVPEKSYPRPVG